MPYESTSKLRSYESKCASLTTCALLVLLHPRTTPPTHSPPHQGVRHFNRKYVLGMIIEKTLHKADATSAARYDIPVGTSFYTLLVNEVDYWS